MYGADRDDVVQEVALRAFVAWSDDVIVSSFTGWCAGAARHVSADHWRGRRDEPLAPGSFELVSPTSTEEVVEGRLGLIGFSRAWKALSPRERQAMLSAPPAGGDALERNRYYVGLHRLRARTRRLAESFTPAAFGAVNHLRQLVGTPAVEATAAVVMAVAGLAVGTLASVPGATTPARRPPAVAGPARPRAVDAAPATPSTVSDVDAAGSRSRRDGRLLRRVESPVERRAETELPDGRGARAGVWHGDPHQPPPLACAGVVGLTPPVCVDYPVRP